MRRKVEIKRGSENDADTPVNDDNNTSTTLDIFWKEFCQETSCHGLGNIIRHNNKYKIRRFFWIICVLVSMGFLIWVMYREFKVYGEHPTFTKIEVNYFDERKFPAVTICNMSPLSKSKINDSKRMENYYVSISDVRHWALPINWSDPIYKEEGYFDPLKKSDTIFLSKTAAEMFVDCYFDHSPFNCSNDFKLILTDRGTCFTWNSEGHISTRLSGTSSNLQIVVNVNVTDYFWSNDIATGVKVVVHDHEDEPDVEDKGFVVPPGTIAYTAATHLQYSYLPAPYKMFADETCVDRRSEDVLKLVPKGQVYSYEACIKSCRSRYLRKVCRCIDVSDPGDGPYCSPYQYKECYMKHVGDLATKGKCDCRLPCEMNMYDLEHSYGLFPSPFVAQKLVDRKLASSISEISENCLLLKIYFDNLSTFRFRQLPKYGSVGEVLGNLGGDMGLFLGASILTVTELCEFVVIGLVSIVSVLWKRHTEKSQS